MALLAAHDGAAAFIASDGQLRGARLEPALRYLRRTQVKLHASDLELAQAILVQWLSLFFLESFHA